MYLCFFTQTRHKTFFSNSFWTAAFSRYFSRASFSFPELGITHFSIIQLKSPRLKKTLFTPSSLLENWQNLFWFWKKFSALSKMVSSGRSVLSKIISCAAEYKPSLVVSSLEFLLLTCKQQYAIWCRLENHYLVVLNSTKQQQQQWTFENLFRYPTEILSFINKYILRFVCYFVGKTLLHHGINGVK